MKFVSNESLNQLAKERDEIAKQRAAASKARAAGLGGELTDAKEIDALIKASQMNNSAVLSRLKEKNPDAVIYTASDEFKPKVSALARSVEAGWDTVKSGVGGVAKGAVGLATTGAELARNYNIATGVAELVGGEFEKSVDGWIDQQNAAGRANAIAANQWIDDKVNLSKDTQLAQIAMAAQMKSDDSFWGTVKALYRNPSASGVMVADSLGQMVPYLVAGGGVAAAGRLGVGAVSGVASASIDYNATINEGVVKALSERGLAPTLANIRTITADKEIMQPLAEKAVRRAAAVGAVSGIGAGVAGKMVASASTGVGKVGAAAGELVAQGAFEAGSEVAGQLAGEGRITDKGEIYAGAVLGGVLSLPEFAQHAANARRVAAREKRIVEAAKNSEMYAEDAAFSEQMAAEQIAIESGSEEKYLPSHTLNQEQKAAVAAQYPQYAKAIESGDTIKLTNEEYVGLIASDALPEASSLVRSHVDGLSEVEAQQMADNPFDAALIAQQVHDAQIASIKTRVMEGLQASTFKDADRAGYAELVGAFYDSTSRRLGITPKELDSMLGLQVKSNLGQTETGLNQERAGELMVTHAISADNLIKTLRNRNGDLLYPSLGISKEAIESFGEITLIGDKGMIDPESGATVWDRDSFTGMYPSTVNAPAQPVADRASAALETIKSLTGNTIKPSKSVDESIEYKQMFLSENGIEIDVDAIRSELNLDKLGAAIETGKKSDVPNEYAHLFEKTSPIGFASLVHSAKTGTIPYSNYVKKVDEQIAARKQEFDNFIAGLESEERDTFTGELATDEYILNALKGETIRKEDVNSISTMVGFYASQKSDITDIRRQGKKLISAEERTKAFEDLQRKYYDSGMTIEEIMDSDSAKAKSIKNAAKKLGHFYMEAKPAEDRLNVSKFRAAVIPEGTPIEVENALRDAGLDVRRYGADNRNEVVRNASVELGLLFQQNPELEANGWYNPETSTININASADMSTFIHESGHFFLDAYERLIAVDDSGVFQEELGRVLEWTGFDGDVDAWLSSTIEQKRETHEKFARGFEAYMREGRAPTPELNNIFRQFAEFLKVIYRSIRDLNVELSDSVRGVMDRMLVADELVETHGAQGDGVGEASARMQRILESDAEIRTRYNRERQAEERRITEQLMKQPEYQAMVALESGVDASVIWEELGYGDEKAMLDAVRAAVPLDEAVKDLADQYIIDKYGEIPNAEKLAMHATASAYNTKTLESIASENPDKSVDYRTVTQAAKQFAQARIWGMKIVDLEPYRHGRAEQQIMRQIERKGASPELVIQRLQQAAMARATSRAKIEAEKRIKSLRKIAKTKSKTVDAEFYEQIQAILSYYELSDKPKREVREFGEFVTELEEQGMTLDVDVSLLRPQPVQDLTVSELNALYDVVKQIERAGRNKYRTIRAGKIRDVRKIQAEIQTNVEANWKGKTPRKHAARNWRESTKDVLDKYFVSNLRIGAIADVIDGGKTGAFHRHVLRPLQEAANKEATLKKEVTQKLMEAIKPILGDKTEVRLSNGMVLGVEQRFVALLNMGNEGNMQRLVDGYRLTKEDIRLIVSSFTPDQLQAAQDIWDIYESMYPEVERIEMEITGKRPEKVEPKPLTVIASTGERVTLRGGYYPAKYDTMADATSAAREEASQTLDQLKGKNGMKTLRKTFTKSRSEKVNRPILLSLSGMAQSMQEHIHMTTHAEALHDVKRIMSLKNPDGLTVMEVVHNKMGAQYSQYLRTWMDHVAAGVDSSYGDNFFKWLRSNAATSMMGFSALTMTAQVAGLVNSLGNLGFKNFFKGFGTVILHPMRSYKEAFKRSEFLRNRQFTMYREASEVADKFTTSKLGRANKAIKQWAFAGIAAVQSFVDVITWYGSYSEALENGVSGNEAVAYADQSVTDIQGDQALVNASAFERGGEAAKIFSMMSSYFTTLYNNLWMLNKSARHSALKKAWMNFFMLVIPSMAEKALRDAVQEDDEDKTLEERIIDYAVGGTIESTLGMFIGVREVASVVSAVATDDPVFAYRGPAATMLFSSTGKLAQQIAQGEADMALTNALLDAIGAATGLPMSQLKRTIRGTIALEQGKAESPTAVLYGYKGKLNEQ